MIPFNLSYWICLFFGAVCLILNRPFLEKSERNKPLGALLYKTLASLCFMIIAALCLLSEGVTPSKFHIVAIIGLLAGFLGDILLALRHVYPQKYTLFFVVGAVVFFLEHGLFSAYFMFSGTINAPLTALIFVLGFSVVTYIFAHMNVDGGKLKFGIYVYIGAVILTCANFITAFVVAKTWATAMLAVASILFAASDVILCAYNFGRAKSFKNMYFIHYLYYPAQVLIAVSLLFFG